MQQVSDKNQTNDFKPQNNITLTQVEIDLLISAAGNAPQQYISDSSDTDVPDIQKQSNIDDRNQFIAMEKANIRVEPQTRNQARIKETKQQISFRNGKEFRKDAKTFIQNIKLENQSYCKDFLLKRQNYEKKRQERLEIFRRKQIQRQSKASNEREKIADQKLKKIRQKSLLRQIQISRWKQTQIKDQNLPKVTRRRITTEPNSDSNLCQTNISALTDQNSINQLRKVKRGRILLLKITNKNINRNPSRNGEYDRNFGGSIYSETRRRNQKTPLDLIETKTEQMKDRNPDSENKEQKSLEKELQSSIYKKERESANKEYETSSSKGKKKSKFSRIYGVQYEESLALRKARHRLTSLDDYE